MTMSSILFVLITLLFCRDCLSSALRPCAAAPSRYNRLVLFGDFLASRAENNDPYSAGSFPPNPPFSDRRFCNGPVWTEYLNDTGRVLMRNYEVGGATSSNSVIQGATGLPGRYSGVVSVPSADEQVDAFIADSGAWANLDINRTVFSVSTINDLFYDPSASGGTTVAIWRVALARLKARVGAKNFLLFDPYDVSQVPLALQANETLKETYSQYSRDLTNSLLHLRQSWISENRADTVIYFSLQETLSKLSFYGSPFDFGYDHFASYGRCLENFYVSPNWTVCDDVTKYVWWDEYHPTTKTHEILAHDIVSILAN